jgi:hypothetical protein
MWHKTHSPEDSNKVKAALHEMQNASFAAYVSTLKLLAPEFGI